MKSQSGKSRCLHKWPVDQGMTGVDDLLSN